jgi:heat-inducible transcriptional repressor
MRQLNQREQVVLNALIQHHIQTCQPVGSRQLAKILDLGISPATIRNVMMDLEDLGLITPPHKSAGRVPSDLGYRWYVDHLRQMMALSPTQQDSIRQNMEPITSNVDNLLQTTSFVLGEISHQIGMVLAPRLEKGICEKLQLVELASNRILLVMTFQAGVIKTLTMEITSEIPRLQLQATEQVLNERLAGLTLGEIRRSMSERLKDVAPDNDHLISVFLQTAPELLAEPQGEDLHLGDFSHWVIQPEFESTESLRQVLTLLSNKNMVADVMRQQSHPQETTVTIGQENPEEEVQSFSLVTSPYKMGDVVGILGILGPKRMEYSRIIPVVRSTAHILTDVLRVQ